MALSAIAPIRSSILRAGFVYAVANALSAGVPFLLLPVLTRALSPGDYGMVVSFFMLVTFSNSLAGLNVHSAISVKWFTRQTVDFPGLVGTALLLAAGSTAFCGILLVSAAPFLQNRLALAPGFWFLAAVQTGATVVLGARTALWQSQGQALRAASLQVGAAVLNITLSLLAVFALSLGGPGRILGSATASLCSATVAAWLLFRSGEARWSVGRAELRWLLRFGVPLVPYALAGALLATADRFSVSAVLGREALGIYGTAAQLGMVVNVLADAQIKATSPWVYSQLAAQTARARLRVVGAAYLSIPAWITIATTVWGGLLVFGSLLLGKRYQPAIDLSLWFLLAGGVTAVATNVCGLFFFTSKNEWLTLVTAAAAIVATLLAPLLATAFGVKGAALSFLSVQMVLLLLSWLLSLRIQPMPWHRPMLAIQVLARSWGSR